MKDNGFKLQRKEAEDTLHKQIQTQTWHVNVNKTEHMCFNQRGDISTLNRNSLKLMDKFTYLGSRVSSNEKYVNTRRAKEWTAFDRLSINTEVRPDR